jgi:hypothetical protein
VTAYSNGTVILCLLFAIAFLCALYVLCVNPFPRRLRFPQPLLFEQILPGYYGPQESLLKKYSCVDCCAVGGVRPASLADEPPAEAGREGWSLWKPQLI